MKRRLMSLLVLAALCMAATAQATTASVTQGRLQKTVYGSGQVQPASQPGVYAEVDADVAQTFVEVGDTVSAGDVLMKLQNDELDADVAQLEYDIQLAQEDVQDVKTHTQWSYKAVLDEDGDPRYDVNTGEPLLQKYSTEISIYAPCDGRIMAVYIEEGSDALAEYRQHGAVVMLSTDGQMKIELEDIEGAQLAYDDKVVVTGEGFETTGTVVSLSRRGMDAVILVASDDYPMDAPVTVTTEDGELVAEGTLAINKPMAVSAYGGTVKGLMWNIKVGKYLERGDVIARIEWDETPLYYDNDVVLYEYAKKKVELEQAMEKREALTIVAPCDGKIASVDVETGSSVQDGTKLLSLVDTGAGLSLILSVDELDIPMVEIGQQVKISVDALPDVTLTGEVKKIAPLGNTQSSVTTYDVYVTLTGDVDSRVLGGMNVSGEIIVSTVDNALTVPTDALLKDSEGYYVTLQNGAAQSVTVGLMTDERTEILSGLTQGQTVVY